MDLNANGSTTLPVPDLVFQMFSKIYQSSIFHAALELQVWAKLSAGADTADSLAASEHWDPLGTRLLLDDLYALKFLEKEGDQYHLTPEAECYLLPESPTYMGRCLLAEYGWEGYGKLAEAIRSGHRPVGYKATASEVIDTWIGAYARSWAAPEEFLRRCAEMWQDLSIQARDGLQILDVACGPAPRSFALARGHPGVCVTLLDWEPILNVACKVAAELKMEEQITLLPGDLWTVPFHARHYHLIYLGNITHFFSPERNTGLFRKAREALVEDGILVVDAHRREYPDPENPGLWFYAVSEGGATYGFHDYEAMLLGAGYHEIVDIKTKMIKATRHS